MAMNVEEKHRYERIVQHLRDAKALIYHWQVTTDGCKDCAMKLASETAPFVAGLNALLKEVGEKPTRG